MAEESKGNDGNTPSHEESKGNDETSCCRKTWEGLITKFIWRKRKEVMISVLSHNHVGGKPLESHDHPRFIGKPNIGEQITVSLSIDEFAFYDSTVIIRWETYGLGSKDAHVSISLFKDDKRVGPPIRPKVKAGSGGKKGIEWKVSKDKHAEGTDYWIQVKETEADSEETEADSEHSKVYGNSPLFTITDFLIETGPSDQKTDSEQETKDSKDPDEIKPEPATDKYVKENTDTVTSVAACDDYIAWGSKYEDKYGVFICQFDTKRYKTSFYPTKGIVQDLDFNHSSEATKKLVCADLEGYIFIYEQTKTDEQTGLDFKEILNEQPKMNADELDDDAERLMDAHLTAVSSQWDDKGEGLVVVGTDESTVHVFSVNAMEGKLCIRAAEANDEIGRKPKDLVINMQGKVLDVEFLRKQKDSIQLVTADDSGHLSLFEIVADKEEPTFFKVYIDLFQKFNFFAVEPGCMLSSSDDGSKIVVACGKKMGFAPTEENPYTEPTERTTSAESILEQSKAIVLERVKSKDGSELQSYIDGIEELEKKTKVTGSEKDRLRAIHKCFDTKGNCRTHDAWEEVASFYHDSLVLCVDMSGDGKRIAVATENKEALVYDVDFGCTIRNLRCEGRVKSICLDNNGKQLLVGGFDKKLQHFNIEEGFHKSFIKTFTEAKKVKSVSIDSQGTLLAIATNSSVMVFKMNADFVKEAVPQPFREIQKKVLVIKLSPDGRLLAVGDSSEVNVYDLDITEEIKCNCKDDNGLEKMKANVHTNCNKGEKCKGTIEAGSIMFGCKTCGYYACSKCFPPPVFSKRYNGEAAIEGLDFKKSDSQKTEEYILAVGSWNCSAYVYYLRVKTHFSGHVDLQAIGKSLEFKRDDRIFDVCLTDDGRQLAVGGRDKKVALYQLPEFGQESSYEHDPDKELIYFQKGDVDRVYCCAISPKGTYAVYGGISKKLLLYKVKDQDQHLLQTDQNLLQTYYHKASINRVQFMHEEAFCAVSGDGLFVIYQVNNPTPTLQINLDGPANSIALSKEAEISVIGHGKKVTVFRNEGYGPLDCPSMALARKLLDDPKSLDVALKSHPTLVNMSDSSKKTLLHYAVDNDNMDALDVLLTSKAKCGLLRDINGHTALMCAVAKSQKMMIDKLLTAIISKDIANTPAAFQTLFIMMKKDGTDKDANGKSSSNFKKLCIQRKHKLCVFEWIGLQFPDVLIRFLGKLKMERCEDRVQQGLVLARMAAPILFGHDRRSPMNFWKYYHDVHQDDEDGFLDDSPKYQVFAFRLPIEGMCGGFDILLDDNYKVSGDVHKGSDDVVKGQNSNYTAVGDGDQSIRDTSGCGLSQIGCCFGSCGYQKCCGSIGKRFFSPLEVIVDASRTLKDCSVFDKDTIVHDLVMFKWQILGPIFKFQAYFYTIYLALCVIFVLSLTKVHCSECDPGYFSNSTHLLACRVVAPILIVLSLYYVFREIRQFIGEYKVVTNVDSRCRKFWIALKHHFYADIWNILDIMAFVTQLVTDIFYYSTYSNAALGFAAVSILFAFWKILFYARGWYEHWGPFVKMIQASLRSMVSFVAVLIVFLLGYAFAFTIVLNASPDFNSPSQSLKVVTLMVYGEFSDDLLDEMDGWKLVTVLFEVMLLTCVVMMLNLLVAILSDSYTDVKEHSNRATIYEIAKIIVEIERVDLIRLSTEILFPKWIHALKPRERRSLKVKTAQNKTFAMIAEVQQEIKNLHQGLEDLTRTLAQAPKKPAGSTSSTEGQDIPNQEI